MSAEQDKEAKAVTSFLTGAQIVIPAAASLMISVGTVVWFAGEQNKELELLQQQFDNEKQSRISLEVEVKLNSERLGDQAVVLGRFEENLNNVEKTGNETLKLLRDYTGRP